MKVRYCSTPNAIPKNATTATATAAAALNSARNRLNFRCLYTYKCVCKLNFSYPIVLCAYVWWRGDERTKEGMLKAESSIQSSIHLMAEVSTVIFQDIYMAVVKHKKIERVKDRSVDGIFIASKRWNQNYGTTLAGQKGQQVKRKRNKIKQTLLVKSTKYITKNWTRPSQLLRKHFNNSAKW